MWKKIVQFAAGKDCSLRERMFRVIILVGGVATVITIIENFILMQAGVKMLPFLLLLLVVMGIFWVATFKYQKYDLAATVLGILIMFFIMPPMFFSGGGIEGGAPIWLVVIFLYMFLMFKGNRIFLKIFF